MKTFNKILLGIGLVSLSYSCTDLEEDLVGDLTSDFTVDGVTNQSFSGGAFTVSDELTSAFGALRGTGTAGHGGYFSVQSVSSDEMAVTQKGGDWYDGGIWIDIHRHAQTSNNGPIKDTWNGGYNAIAEVNNAIKNGGLNANLTAQAKVLRAYLHWRLLDLYGRIRFVDENTTSAQLTRTAGFQRIESEILSALGVSGVTASMDLSGSALNTTDTKYRINQFAALGILSKLYLNAEIYTGTARWQEAHDAADYIISNGSYSLSDSSVSVPNPSKRPAVGSDPGSLTGYAAVFSPSNFDNPEIIWSVEYDEATAGGMNFHHMSLHYASQYTYLFSDQPWNGYSALEEFYNSYEDGDVRKESNFIVGEQTDFTGATIVDLASENNDPAISYSTSINELEPNAGRTDGARLGKFAFKNFARGDLDNDYPIMRLGDVYLMRAEAKARAAGNWSLASADVNTIRARAGVSALGSIDANSFLAERGREMFMESSRRTDLIRFGKWSASWWEKTNSDAYRIVMPIPSDVINNSNGALSQNTGY
jgi:starch-binding outer membrane protein, SusD/RagB family